MLKHKELFTILILSCAIGLAISVLSSFLLTGTSTKIPDLNLIKAKPLLSLLYLAPVILPTIAFLSSYRYVKNNRLLKEKFATESSINLSNTQLVAEISNQKLDTEFTPLNEMGKSLKTLRENLLKNKEKENDYNWITTGTNEVGGLLRKHQKIDSMIEELVVYLCKKTTAVQCAFYILKEDSENYLNSDIVLASSYAYHRKKYLNHTFKMGQGLVGQSAIEKDTLFRTEIPDDYTSIKSGLLGDKKPSAILIVPLITNEKVYGLVELAGIHTFTEQQIKFMKAISDIVARTIFNITVSERTLVLLQESRKAEEAQRMRAKMQALSENSLDLIVRIDLQGNILYINATIETLTQQKIDSFMGTDFMLNNALPPEFVATWKEILDRLNVRAEKQTHEIKLTQEEGVSFFKLSAIPEFDNNKQLETILLVSHDITQQKISEELILDKNKKITESINYSYRIQSSLMPTEAVLQSHFPDSFMLYLPKDVVSGDFPFIYAIDDVVYVAAIDCTGHGVPGALMSFIGYFTLNQIMSLFATSKNAGEILDMLHAEVQAKLKQDTGESDSKDGMDVALVKINTKTLEVEFAGAHRPLYLIRDNALEEIKSDKYPIAGMYYKTRQPFVNHVLQLRKGDSLLFNTDGLPDQFGGVGGKFKFMSKKVRAIIEATIPQDMSSVKKEFEKEFYEWKGNTKQMDDVLLIGIKL